MRTTASSTRLSRQIVLPLLVFTAVAGILATVVAALIIDRDAARFVAFGAAAASIGSVVVGSWAARRVSDPLGRLVDRARMLSAGDFSARVEPHGAAELAELATTFNQMTDSLRERSDSLTKKMLELATLYEMSRSVGGTFDMDELLGSVLDAGMQIFSADAGCVVLRDRETEQPRLMCARGTVTPSAMSSSMSAWVLREGRALVNNADASSPGAVDSLTGSATALAVPLRTGDDVIGALTLGSYDPAYRFDAEDVRLLSTIANQVTMAVGNIELFSSLQEAYLATVRSLAAAIDAKDAYTRGHSDRVAAYATAIAEKMGLPSDQRMALEMAAYLHDIGKIGIPEGILRKPGRLEESEMAQMRHHPLIGAGILKPVAFPWPITPIVRHHHEAFDGTGYPARLAGEDIPLLARILTVADSYEAMVSDRPYRRGREPHDALQELQRCSGTQFDPAIVGLFSAIVLEAEVDGSLPITGVTDDIGTDEALDAVLGLGDGVLESFGRLGGDRLVENVEFEVNERFAELGLPFRIAGASFVLNNDSIIPEDFDSLRAALRSLDAAIAHVSGSTLVDHFYAEAMAAMPARLRAVAEELGLLPSSAAVA